GLPYTEKLRISGHINEHLSKNAGKTCVDCSLACFLQAITSTFTRHPSLSEYTHEYRHAHPFNRSDHSSAGRSADVATQSPVGLRAQRRYRAHSDNPAAALLFRHAELLAPVLTRRVRRDHKRDHPPFAVL